MIWISLLSAVAVYGIVGFTIATPAEDLDPPVPEGLWYGMAVVLGLAAFLAPRFLRERSPGLPADLLSWALDESIAVVGLVAVFLGLPTGIFVVFLVASWLLLVWHRPRASSE